MGKVADRELTTLLRAAAELYARSNTIQSYLSQASSRAETEYKQLGDILLTALTGIEKAVTSKIPIVVKIVDSQPGQRDTAIEELYAEIERFTRWFVTVHELLVYLPRQHPTPEAAYTLQSSFGRLFTDHSPTITLGSIFNAFEYDFLEVMKERIPDYREIILDEHKSVVLQLPICDRRSPAAWAILAHELGHAIDSDAKISDRAVAEFRASNAAPYTDKDFEIIRNWCGELCADLIAAKALGPAPLLALVSLEFCVYPSGSYFAASGSHPSTRWRLSVCANFFNILYPKNSFLQREIESVETGWELQVKRRFKTTADEYQVADRVAFKDIVLPLAKLLTEEVLKLDIPSHTITDSSLNRCIRRLEAGLPIGAQGEERGALQKAVATHRKKVFTSLEQQKDDFYRLTERFRENPLDVPMILLANQERRLEMIQSAIDDGNEFTSQIETGELVRAFDRLDDRVEGSIRSSSVHKRYCAKPAISS